MAALLLAADRVAPAFLEREEKKISKPYTPNPWTKHYQGAWENRAANPDLPLWARVVAFAYARHEANGHANFKRGDLSWLTGTPPKGDKPFRRRDRSALRNAIDTAVKYGWLAEGSCSECLVVPEHEIVGPPGDPFKPCPVHERKKARQKPRLTLVPPAECG